MRRAIVVGVMSCVLFGGTARAVVVSQQIGAGDTALLFGGTDAEGGIGDWYLSNGVVEAIVDDVGIQSDLTPLVPGSEPIIQSEVALSGGTLIDVGRVGQNDDQLTQMFTVGGLSTSNFLRYDAVSAPSPGTIRAVGKLLYPPVSALPSPCIDIVTDYTVAGSDPFVTVTTTATNNCGVAATGFGGFLDVFIWTLRSEIPFSGGGTLSGGRGFDHPVLDFASPAAALELPTFLAAPGVVTPADGIMDPANGTTSGEVSYGVLPVVLTVDADGAGGTPPVVTSVDGLFGVNSNLVSALGSFPAGGADGAGATLTYERRLYVGGRNDVRSVSDPIVTALATRLGFSTGTISGTVSAADAAGVEASILVTRTGRCQGNAQLSCKASVDCTGGSGPCADPVPTTGQTFGDAMTQVRTDATGAFGNVVLPQGDYELRVSSPERDDVVVGRVTVGAGDTPVTIPPLAARGTLAFTVKEKVKGAPLLPAKLTLKGVSPTADPRFHYDLPATLGGEDLRSETFGGTQAGSAGQAAGQGNVVYTTTGSGAIQLRPGTYDVYASRGFEYSVAQKRVTIASGMSASVDLKLKRVLKTRNALSADFHVHSGRSLDASAPLRDRVAAFAGEGVEVMVSTDHDKNVDYSPIIDSLGLSSRLRSIVGEEVTGSVPNAPAFPQSIGHINAWPLTVAKDQRRDGTIQDEYVAPNWLFTRLRGAGAEVVQYNHPRAGVSGLTSIGIFNNIGCGRCANAIDTTCSVDGDCPASPTPQECTCVGYQPTRALSNVPNDILLDTGVLGPGTPANPGGTRNIDFDVMEIANGAKDVDFTAYRQVRDDWFSLTNQGFYRPATGVSDSHRITVEHAGWSRTFVLGVGDDPAAVDVTALDGQVKAGNMVVSAGPYIELAVKSGKATAPLGGLVASSNGKVKLKIRVTSAAWVPVEEVRLIANGVQVAAYDATTHPRVQKVPSNFQSTGRTVRFAATLTRTVAADTWFLVEAGPKLPADPEVAPASPGVVNVVEPDVVPLAFTNPVFVDRDGNGTFDPPGLAAAVARRAPATFWGRVRAGLQQLASRWTREVVADEVPGRMTGVTREQKARAIKKGEYFPLHQFAIPPDAVTTIRRAREAERTQPGPARPAGGGR